MKHTRANLIIPIWWLIQLCVLLALGIRHLGHLFVVVLLIVVVVVCLLSSCSKDIDERIKECYNANDTIINLADLYLIRKRKL